MLTVVLNSSAVLIAGKMVCLLNDFFFLNYEIVAFLLVREPRIQRLQTYAFVTAAELGLVIT